MASRNNYTVFVVEDSDVYRSVLIQALETEKEFLHPETHYDLHGFASGEECLKQMHLKPDIVITDYLLNGGGYENNMNGFEFLRQIKRLAPKTDVIVLSCQQNIEVMKNLIREGIKEYIKKEGLGQYKVKKVMHGLIQEKVKKKKMEKLLQYAAVALLIIGISILVFWLAQ